MKSKFMKSVILVLPLLFSSIINPASPNTLTWVVAKSGLNLRQRPEISAGKVATIPNFSVVYILEKLPGQVTIDGTLGSWYKIQWKNLVGYAFDRYISVSYGNAEKTFVNMTFHQGIQCTGRTSSEFTRQIEFFAGNKYKIAFEAPYTMKCTHQLITEGDYRITADTIILTPRKKTEIIHSGEKCEKKTMGDKSGSFDRNDGGSQTLVDCDGFLEFAGYVGRKANLP